MIIMGFFFVFDINIIIVIIHIIIYPMNLSINKNKLIINGICLFVLICLYLYYDKNNISVR